MEWIEVTAKTVDEAKDAALDQLGVDEIDAEFEVLEMPKAGLFGRLRSEARVRARVLPTTPPPKLDRRERRRSGGRDSARRPKESRGASQGEQKGASERGKQGPSGPSERGARGAGRESARQGGSPGRGAQGPSGPSERGAQGPSGPSERGAQGPSGPSERGAQGGRRNRQGQGGSERARRPAAAPEVKEGTSMTEEEAAAEQKAAATTFLAGLLDAFDVEGSIEHRQLEDETTEFAVQGEGLGLLIGQKGQTLTAVQELTRTVVQRTVPVTTGRLVVDVGGYRQARRGALERFTRTVAEQVRENGVARALEAMPPADRKVVHDTVNTIPGVVTSSEGEEPRRRVVISPDDTSDTSD